MVTRCIADFLGFGEQIRDVKNPKAKYSENQIYQHITNCQVFLSYNTDETKLLKRQAAFKESMQFLLKLTERGNILEASRWDITKPLRIIENLFKAKSLDNESLWMKDLGRSVAALIFKKEKDIGKAAAILLLTALDIAYISVLSVSSSSFFSARCYLQS